MPTTRRAWRFAVHCGLAVFATGLLCGTVARADDVQNADVRQSAAMLREAKTEAPISAFAYSAYGTHAGTYGVQGYAVGLTGSGSSAMGGGGFLAWGAPMGGLTLVVDAPRDVYVGGHFAPSVAGIVRLLGSAETGFSLGGLGKYKVEGFGTDPNGDIESEIEGGLLLSYSGSGLHVDLNSITGFGLTEEGEIDTEARFRLGYDVASFMRIGLDGQGRYRLAGTKKLLNGASYDFAGGPQVIVGTRQYFGALTAGPATLGIADSGVVGGTAIVTLCGML